jgi:hypothetical protein
MQKNPTLRRLEGPAGAWRPSGWRGARRLSESVLAEEVFPGRRALRPKFSDSLQPPGYVEEARRTRLLAREPARTRLGQKRAVARPQFSESEIGGSSSSGNRLTHGHQIHEGQLEA